MKRSHPISEQLIAPCGMNCAVCSRYLAHVNDLKRSKCIGCRPRNEKCKYLFGKCEGINHRARGDAAFCFECTLYPCAQINRIDKRYRKNFNASLMENLEFIRNKGIEKFIKAQHKKYRCPKCGGMISVHNGKCFNCDTVTKLVDISCTGDNKRKTAKRTV